MDGDVANVGCDAILCPAGTSADEGRATSLVSCETCSTANFMGSTACAAAPGESVDEEAVLVEVYNKMGGRYWQSANDWLTDVNHCQWEGITCENGSVTEISLSNRGLTGLPPDSLFLLPALRVLDLSSNSILFDFSSAARAKSLEVLDLSQCDLPYLTGIGDLSSSSLRKLSVASNDMRGMVPSGLFSISSLEELDISHNQFSGALSGIESLSNLVRFRCSGNNLSGPFPAAFGYLSGLVEIMAADNQFSGSLSSVAQPEAFIDLTGNRITSINDELCSRGSLMEGAVGVFSCNAILCPTGTFNEIGRQSSQSNPCRSCSTANYMGTKRCEGQVSSGEVDILRELYTTTYGDSWLNNAGWATSSDYCSWYGITCNSAGNVIKIDLEANNLMGEPSKSIFGLPSLAELNLSKNRISFQFAGIGEAQSLVTLKLSGLGLNSVDGIGEGT